MGSRQPTLDSGDQSRLMSSWNMKYKEPMQDLREECS